MLARLKPHLPPIIGLGIVVALMTFALFAGGCNSNPRVDFANAQDTYNAAVQTLVLNRDKFSDDTWEDDVLPLINAGDAALDQFDVLTSSGLPADSAKETLRQVLIGLAIFLEQLE